jgi:hypothetical protein
MMLQEVAGWSGSKCIWETGGFWISDWKRSGGGARTDSRDGCAPQAGIRGRESKKQAGLVPRGDDGPDVDLCGWPCRSLGMGAILWPPVVPPQVSEIVHGTTFCFCFVPKKHGDGHTADVLFFAGGEGKPAFSSYSGSLFNHVPSTSQARLMKQERRVFARRNYGVCLRYGCSERTDPKNPQPASTMTVRVPCRLEVGDTAG